jgi:hypothetical protein
MCIIDSQAVPISLLESGESPGDLMKALGTLQAFSTIVPRKIESGYSGMTEKSFDLHRLVRNWLRLHAKFDLWMATMLKILTQKYPDLVVFGWKQQPKWMAYLPHALTLLTSAQFAISSTDSGIASIFHSQAGIGRHAADGVICGICAAQFDVEGVKND